jgi:hypothetical protein
MQKNPSKIPNTKLTPVAILCVIYHINPFYTRFSIIATGVVLMNIQYTLDV